MSFFDLIKRLFQPADEGMERTEPAPKKGEPAKGRPSRPGLPLSELARRLKMSEEELRQVEPIYHEFAIPKRSGGQRRIYAPTPELKAIQRRILRRVLARLKCHPAAKGFERGQSIVTNALPHVRQAVILRMDLKNYFESTKAQRVRDFFLRIGWGKEATEILLKLCTHRGGLPPGAPTSPRLSNLVNYRMDQRLTGLAKGHSEPRTTVSGSDQPLTVVRGSEASYTRYADDLTFSFPGDDAGSIHRIVFLV